MRHLPRLVSISSSRFRGGTVRHLPRLSGFGVAIVAGYGFAICVGAAAVAAAGFGGVVRAVITADVRSSVLSYNIYTARCAPE